MKIEFTTSGAAFCDPCTGEESPLYKRIEVLNILNGIVIDIELGVKSGIIMDANGNKIGSWEV